MTSTVATDKNKNTSLWFGSKATMKIKRPDYPYNDARELKWLKKTTIPVVVRAINDEQNAKGKSFKYDISEKVSFDELLRILRTTFDKPASWAGVVYHFNKTGKLRKGFPCYKRLLLRSDTEVEQAILQLAIGEYWRLEIQDEPDDEVGKDYSNLPGSKRQINEGQDDENDTTDKFGYNVRPDTPPPIYDQDGNIEKEDESDTEMRIDTPIQSDNEEKDPDLVKDESEDEPDEIEEEDEKPTIIPAAPAKTTQVEAVKKEESEEEEEDESEAGTESDAEPLTAIKALTTTAPRAVEEDEEGSEEEDEETEDDVGLGHDQHIKPAAAVAKEESEEEEEDEEEEEEEEEADE